jgi:hypothetical protein
MLNKLKFQSDIWDGLKIKGGILFLIILKMPGKVYLIDLKKVV